jgi:hypothetical protein
MGTGPLSSILINFFSGILNFAVFLYSAYADTEFFVLELIPKLIIDSLISYSGELIKVSVHENDF